MGTAGSWVRDRRTALGLSGRDLARVSGVAYPTITRIENGRADPRWSTLEKLAAALGQTLELASNPLDVTRLADLAGDWLTDRSGRDEPNWTRLRAFADQLTLHPEYVAAVIATAPDPSGSPFHDSLLAAIAETCADDAGIQRPKWTRRYPPLLERWDTRGTPHMKAAHIAATPEPFLARNIVIPRDAIWRARPSRAA